MFVEFVDDDGRTIALTILKTPQLRRVWSVRTRKYVDGRNESVT